MADEQKKYLSEDEMGFGTAAKAPKYLSEEDMGFAEKPGGFAASAKQSVGSLIKGAGQAAADFVPGVGQDNAVKQYGQSVIDANPTEVKSLGDIADKPGMAVREAAGNAVGSIGGVIGARVLGNAITAAAPLTGPFAPATAAVGQGVAWLGPYAAAALPSFGGIRQKQIEDDPTRQDGIGDKALAAAGAATVGLIENKFGPQQWALSALSKEGRAKLAEKFAADSVTGAIGKGVAKGAAIEGAEELAQNPVEQIASYQDPTTPENVQDTLFGGAMGFIGGGVLGGGMGGVSQAMSKPQAADAGQAQQAGSAAEDSADVAPLALPAPAPITGTPDELLAQSEAERAAQVAQAEARAADVYRQRDEFDATREANQVGAPIPFDRTPAEELAAQRKAAMGIDPAAGPLSAGAAIAVESQAAEEMRLGAASVLADGAARAQQAQAERAAWEAANPGIPFERVAVGQAESAPSAAPAPSGSFGAMSDLADLVSQERQDVAQRRAGIAERQGQRREFDLAEADRRTAESMRREAQARRRAVLDAVLADPETTNPAGRFAATLRREGYRDSAPTADELQTIQRFEDVRAAQPAPPEAEPSAPNELDPAALGIRERRAPAQQPAPAAPPKNLREGMVRAQAERESAAAPAAQVAPPATAPSLNPGEAWARMDAGQRTALAGRLQGVPPIVSKNVHRADWAKINPALQGKLAEAMAPRAAAPIEGADLGDGWAAFRPESGTAGVPRAEMPQIKAEHRGAMVNFMNARGVRHQEETVPAASLKPTQAEFSREKVARAKAFEGGSRSILVSADNHVLDGHHQWMAARDKGEDVKVIRLNAPIRDLVGLAHDFPSSTTAGGAATAEGGQDGQSLEQQADAGMASQSRAQGRADVGRGAGDLVQPADGASRTGVGAAAAIAARSREPAEPAGTTGGGGGAVGQAAPFRPKNLVQLVREAGGVNIDRKADINQDSRTVGVFRKGGMDLDGLLAELLQQHGFLADADVTDTTSGAERAAELLRAALAGERVLSMNDVDAVMAQDTEAEYRDEIRRKAAEYGIRTTFRPFGDIERDVQARDGELAPEDASAYDYANGDALAESLDLLDDINLDDMPALSEEGQMRALGFTEEEINEAINRAGPAEVQGQPGQARPRAAQEGGRAGAEEDPGAQGGPLESYSQQDLAARDETQRLADEARTKAEKAVDDKARADAERDSFTLSGSDRPADVLAAQGQGGLFEQPAPAANQEPIKNETRANAGPAAEISTSDQAPVKKPAADSPAVGNAPSPLEALFSDLNSDSTRKANKAKKAAAKQAPNGALEYVQISKVDSLAQGALANATEQKERAWKRVKSLRARVKDGEAHLRLELIKAEDRWKEAKRYEDTAREQIERDANKAGLTTKRGAVGEANGPAGASLQNRNAGDADPDEARRVQVAIEGKGLIDAARFMTQSADKAKAAVAEAVLDKLQRLEAAGVNLELHIAHRGDMVPEALHNGRGFTETGFDEKGRDIVVWLNGADVASKVGTDEETLLHELVHAATTGMVRYGQLNPGTAAGRSARDLMAVTDAIAEHISQRFEDADAGRVTLTEFEQDMREGANNAFRSDDEVLAWALSSREAQTYLEGIPYRSGGSMWSRFVSAVRSLLGLTPQQDTALSEVLAVAERLMTDDAPMAGRAAFWHKRGMRMVQQQGRGSIVQSRQAGGDKGPASSFSRTAGALPSTIKVDGVERPTTNSKGQQIHPTEEGVRNFWRWFGDSVFVDEAGRPNVFYHSSLKDTRVFNKHGGFMGYTGVSGISVTDNPEMASRYLDRYGNFDWKRQPFEKNVMAVYVKAENPLYRNEPFKTNLMLGAPLPEGYVSVVERMGHDALVRDDVISRKGAVKHSDAKNAIRGKEIVLFSPEQIKSATGNTGAFSGQSPDIRLSQSPAPAAPGITYDTLPDAFAKRFPKLAGAVKTMLDRGALGQKGGLVVLDTNDEVKIAREFADRTGRTFDETVQMFESGIGPEINGFYDALSGTTFLVGPNLGADTAPPVLLHEMVHGQQRQSLDEKALAMINERAQAPRELGKFLTKVAQRMEDVGESGNASEATAYIVEMAVQEGRQAGFSAADGPILAWIERNIGKPVADLVRGFVAMARAWALAHGVQLKSIAVDDLVAYAQLGVKRAARGRVAAFGKGASESKGSGAVIASASPDAPGASFSRASIAGRVRAAAARAAAPSPQSALGDLSAQQQAAVNRVFGQPKTMLERAQDFAKDWQKNLVQGVFDQFAPIKEITSKGYMQARLAKGSDSTLEAMLLYGKISVDKDGAYQVDFDGKNLNGFAKTMAKLDGEHDRFLAWVSGLRAERLSGVGLENLMKPEDIAGLKSLADGTTKSGKVRRALYGQALKDLNEFNDSVLKIAEDSGLIDAATRKMYQDTPYVPFYRLSDEDVIQGPSVSKGLVNQSAWKQLKGGTNQLNEDLMGNLLKNWSHLITASANNRAAKEILDTAARMGAATDVTNDVVSQDINGQPVARGSTKGLVRYRGEVVRKIPKGQPYLEDGQAMISDGTAEVKYIGERYFRVDDAHLMDAVASIGFTPKVWKPMADFKRYLTFGVTVNPTFKIRNLIRDSIQAVGTTDLSYNPVKNILMGAKGTAMMSNVRAQMLASGGMLRFGSAEGGYSGHVRRLIEKGVDPKYILDDDNKLKSFWKHKILPAFEAYQELGDRSENVNRAALYEQLLKKGMSHAEAAFWARDMMDFSMHGKWAAVRTLTSVVPFMNARLQGIYKLGRATKADYRRMGATLAAVSMASIGLMLAYGDDDDWKKREDWDRDNSWWFKIGDTAFRIPKPFEVGAVGTIAERSVELMISDEMTGKRFGARMRDLFMHNLSMNPTPQLVKPMIDLYANKDGFSGRDIETPGMEKMRPEDRYTNRTSEVARWLGQMGLPNPAQLVMGRWEGLSPVQIDHLIRGYFAWLGTSTTNVLDRGIRPMMDRGEQPTMRLKDVFLVGNFVETLPSGSSRYVTQLYEQAKEVEQMFASYQQALKEGDTAKAQEIQAENPGAFASRRRIEAAKRAQSIIVGQMRAIERNTTMAGDEKRARLDALELQRDAAARRAVSVPAAAGRD